MVKIYKELAKYFVKHNHQYEEDVENFKIAYSAKNEEKFKFFAELIISTSALSPRKEYFIEKMQSFENVDKQILFQILNEHLDTDFKKINNPEEENNTEEYEIIARLESLENENYELQEQNKAYKKKIDDLSSHIYHLETNLSELEIKYNDALSDQNLSKHKSLDYEEYYKLSIQMSEMKGKLAQKEDYVQALSREKLSIQEESRRKVDELTLENSTLKENLVKYELLKEKMDKFISKNEECQVLKLKVSKLENQNKELEEKLRKLNSFLQIDKGKIMKSVEELSYSFESEKAKNEEIKKELDYYKERILKVEAENKRLLKLSNSPSIDRSDQEVLVMQTKHSDSETNNNAQPTLEDLEYDNESKMLQLEMESKLQILTDEYNKLLKTKDELTEHNILLQNKVQALETQNMKRKEKLKQLKVENTVLNSKVEQLSSEMKEIDFKKIEELKIEHLQTIHSLETNYNNTINSLKTQHQEDVLDSTEKLKLIQLELKLKEKEVAKLENEIEANKQINSNSSLSEQLRLIESLKEISRDEIDILKQKIVEKDQCIENLNKTLQQFTIDLKVTRRPSIKNTSNLDELSKKEELINYYKSQLEKKKVYYEEQERFFTRMFYELSVSNLLSRNSLFVDQTIGGANWQIEH